MLRDYLSFQKWSRGSNRTESQEALGPPSRPSAPEIPQVLSSHVTIRIFEDLQAEEDYNQAHAEDGIITPTSIYPSDNAACAMIRARNKALSFKPKTPSRSPYIPLSVR
ncbi:hypothetical protein N7470_007722 [Penicillium chermesinum]|nr:hypothetical protein N7470_007722 [Penicillium chermesinum]